MAKPRGRPFEPGNTVGRGRPRGSTNRQKTEEDRILQECAPHLLRRCIALALKGDRTAMRLCMERICPPPREASVRMPFSVIRKAKDADKAARKVTEAVGAGVITPSEGESIMSLIERRCRVLEKVDFEQRIEKLEIAAREQQES